MVILSPPCAQVWRLKTPVFMLSPFYFLWEFNCLKEGNLRLKIIEHEYPGMPIKRETMFNANGMVQHVQDVELAHVFMNATKQLTSTLVAIGKSMTHFSSLVKFLKSITSHILVWDMTYEIRGLSTKSDKKNDKLVLCWKMTLRRVLCFKMRNTVPFVRWWCQLDTRVTLWSFRTIYWVL